MSSVTLTDHADAFLNFLSVQKNYSEHTLRAYHNDLYEFIWYVAGQSHLNPENPKEMSSLLVSHVDALSIRAYLGHLYKKKNKKSSVARKLSALRSFFKYLLKHEVIKNNPADLVMTPKQDKPIPAYLTVDDIFRLLDSIDTDPLSGKRDRAMFETLYSTGIRVSELAGLDPDHVDCTAGLIRVLGKGNKERVVPIGKKALTAIGEYREALLHVESGLVMDPSALFLNSRGGRITERSIARILKERALFCGIGVPIFPHAVRHTFATHMLDAGADLRGVQEILGHESLSTTQKYTHVTIDRLMKVYDKAHPRK
ncbi:MAG: tyrosine recombinase XerC [Proteobacteria bacterium]|nr:tyrosine recombinase XerC [Pseudomonadota bacterium]